MAEQQDAAVALELILDGFDAAGDGFIAADDRSGRLMIAGGDAIELRPLSGGSPPQVGTYARLNYIRGCVASRKCYCTAVHDMLPDTCAAEGCCLSVWANSKRSYSSID